MQAAQSAHAAFGFSCEHPTLTVAWHQRSNYLVLLAAPDEQALLVLREKVEAAGLPLFAVTEPDLPGCPLTALSIGPSDAARRMLSSLPLALREEVLV